MAQRRRALSLYRQILREGRRWKDPQESAYIRDEAQRLFRQNRFLTDPAEIDAKLFEAESRMELALHYGIPYPRHFYAPKDTVLKAKNKKTYVENPYMHSYFDEMRGGEKERRDDNNKK